MISNQHKKSTGVWTSAGRLRRPAKSDIRCPILVRVVAISLLTPLLILSNAPYASAASVITATGGTITDVWQKGLKYRVHTFTSSGTFTVTSGSGNVWYLVVAGGGAGGDNGGGGGGAGGYRTNAAYDYAVTVNTYTVTVGAGSVNSGGDAQRPPPGDNSVFDTITSTGGGGGGSRGGIGTGGDGGSGGGGGGENAPQSGGAASPAGQGNAGGANNGVGVDQVGAGGGGAGEVGGDASAGQAGVGGDGLASTISGSSVTRGGGGGGSRTVNGTFGAGGDGGGGTGVDTGNGGAATVNTGGGGGGGGPSGNGGAGGSGVVIIRYLLGGSSTFNTPMKSGLTGYWSFNKLDMNGLTVLDRGGFGKNGTLANSPVATSSFMSGQAMSFASTTSNKISVPYAWSNFISSTEGTISVWVKPIGNAPPLDTGGACSPGQGIVAGKSNMYLYLCRANMSGVDSLLAGVYDGGHKRVSTPFTAGEWTHLVWVRDSTKLYIYKNGVLAGSVSAAGTASVGDEVQIGQTSTDNGSLSFDGSIDEVRVYSRTLTAKEIKLLYLSTKGSKANTSQNSKVPSGLVGLWSFDGPDMAGVTAYDRSGQGNNGTLAGGPMRAIGKLGQALGLDGVNDFVDTADINTLDNASAFTVSAWVKENSLLTDKGIVAKWDFSTQGNFAFQTGQGIAGGLTLFLATTLSDSGTGSRTDTTNAVLTAGKWQHVAVVFDGSLTGNTNRVKMYVDGANVPLTQGAGAVPSSTTADGTATVKIGKFGGSLDRYFNGSIDDTRIYSRALAPSEIKLLYTSGKGLLLR